MKTYTLLVSVVLVVCSWGDRLAAEQSTSELDSLRGEVANIEECLKTIIERLDSIEQQASQDVSNLRPIPSANVLPIKDTVDAISLNRNEDASLSLALFDRAKQLSVFNRSADGRWETKTATRLDAENAPQIVIADLDRNGISEIIVCSEKLRVYSVSREGLTLSWTSIESFRNAPSPKLGIRDLNDDGLLDIAVLNNKQKDEDQGMECLYVYTQTLSSKVDFGLTYLTTFTDEHGYHSTSAMAIADFNGDENPEIVVGNSNGNLWLVASKNGKLNVQKQWKVQSGGAIGPGLGTGNLDGDSASELLVGTNGGNIFVYEFSANYEPVVVATAEAGRLAYGVDAGDIDGDGIDEFVLSRGKLNYAGMSRKDVVVEVWKLTNNQLQRVWQEQTMDVPRPLVQDLDNDGRDDIVVYSPLGGGYEVFEPTW